MKYAHLDQAYLFNPVTIETTGALGPRTASFPEGVREEDSPTDKRGKVVYLSATASVSTSAEGVMQWQ